MVNKVFFFIYVWNLFCDNFLTIQDNRLSNPVIFLCYFVSQDSWVSFKELKCARLASYSVLLPAILEELLIQFDLRAPVCNICYS